MMDTRRQILALVLGVLFVIVFIFSAQKLGQFLRDRVKNQTAKATLTPTPTPVLVYSLDVTPTITPVALSDGTRPSNYPSTGPEHILLLIPVAAAGYYLRKFSK